jgi:acetoin utilization deacetylase AcuC-like enzyme
MKIFVTDRFTFPLPEGHRFPVEKYALLRERLEASGAFARDDFVTPAAATREQVLRAHTIAYWDRITTGDLTRAQQRDLGLPWSAALVERSLRSVGATIEACAAALQDGAAATLAGGTHHAFADRGEGFCLFNDAVIAAREMQALGKAAKLVVVDCDVHQGNGTAALCADDPTIYTYSIHCQSNYPLHKETSDVDVGLPDRTTDDGYLAALRQTLPAALDASGATLAIYLAGADPYEGDRLGRLSVTRAGLLARDRYVLQELAARAIPVVVTMGGGYARDIADTVDVQYATVMATYELILHPNSG